MARGSLVGPLLNLLLNPFDPTFPAAPRATCREAPHRPELHRSALAVRRALSAAPARSLRTSRQRVSQRVEHLANLQQGAANGARPVRSTSELENNARTSTTRTGFVGPVGLMVPRAVAWPASVAVGSGSLVPRRGPREVEMKKGRLRKRGNPEAARRALAAATSGESSAAQLPRSGLPLGAARARELP